MVLNFLLALLPIIWLFVAFLVLKLPGHIGCLISTPRASPWPLPPSV